MLNVLRRLHLALRIYRNLYAMVKILIWYGTAVTLPSPIHPRKLNTSAFVSCSRSVLWVIQKQKKKLARYVMRAALAYLRARTFPTQKNTHHDTDGPVS
jgi:hypothetical protein